MLTKVGIFCSRKSKEQIFIKLTILLQIGLSARTIFALPLKHY